uniref:Uncharacterized protein n=1 Tax=Aegilops tauschii subsp. strangulata TaxID=200361 RepID=A0A453Q277_AEGTS
MFVVQRSWPLVSDKARLDPLVKASVAEEGSVIGIARLATHTTLSSDTGHCIVGVWLHGSVLWSSSCAVCHSPITLLVSCCVMNQKRSYHEPN